jgi:hypothetical protein
MPQDPRPKRKPDRRSLLLGPRRIHMADVRI